MTSLGRIRTVTILIALLAMAMVSRAQTTFEYLQGGDFEQLKFIDSSRGFAVADGGRIHFSQDGGLTWAEATTDNLDPEAWVRLHGLTFRGEPGSPSFKGWAVGEDGVILTTTNDTGTAWQYHNKPNRITSHLQTIESPSDCGTHLAVLRDIVMLDDFNGWAVGDDGTLVSTSNNWDSWADVFGPSPFNCDIEPVDIYQIHFFAERASEPGYVPYSKGVMAAEYGRVYRTDDSGANWVDEAVHNVLNGLGECVVADTKPPLVLGNPINGDNLELWEIAFDDADDADTAMTAAGGVGNSRGYIFRRAAGWDTVSCGAWTQERDYNFSDPAHPSHTTVCGLSTLYTIDAMDFSVSPPRGITGGYAGLLFTRNPNGTSNFDTVNCSSNCSGGCPTGVVWDQTDTGFNNPATMPHPFGNQAALLAGARVTDDVAILAGHFGVITRYEEQPVGPPIITEVGTQQALRFTDCEFWSSTTGLAVGQTGEILRTTDGGATWTAPTVTWAQRGDPGTPQAEVAMINAVAIADAGPYAVAVGTGGHISWSDDYGASWSDVVTLPDPAYSPEANLFDVEYVDASTNTFVAAGDEGRVIISTDGGKTWEDRQLSETQSDRIMGVHFARPMFTNPPMDVKVGYAVTDDFMTDHGRVFKTTDGGVIWNEVVVAGLTARERADLSYHDVVTWETGLEYVVVGEGGTVLEKTIANSNLLWLDLGASAVETTLSDVDEFADGDILRIVGADGVVLFRDFGSWSRVRSRTSFDLTGISFIDPDFGFGVATRGVFLKYDGP